MENVLKPLAKSVLIPSGLPADFFPKHLRSQDPFLPKIRKKQDEFREKFRKIRKMLTLIYINIPMQFNSTVTYYQNKISNFTLNKSSNKAQWTVRVN